MVRPRLGKARVTRSNYRVPISMKRCAPRSFRHKTFSKRKGIKALICCPVGKFKKGKCKAGMETRTILYDKNKWSKQKAERHAKNKFLKKR